MTSRRRLASALLLGGAALAAFAADAPSSVAVRADGRTPVAWRALDPAQAEVFHLGHAVYNTTWLPAGAGRGRRNGLGPLFNAPSCDACHNSRRRGRGPQGDGLAPSDLVLQVGQRLPDGRVVDGHPRFGRILNTDAIAGVSPEATVRIAYRTSARRRADGSVQSLHAPTYLVATPDGATLPGDLVLKPRMAPPVLGAGLLEQVPVAAIVANARPRRGRPQGTVRWLEIDGARLPGRFGWQASEPDIPAQTAAAFAREMGLTTPAISQIDCGSDDAACRHAAHGGTPEVEPALFDAVVAFQRLEAMRRTPNAARHLRDTPAGARLFARTGCADCHRPSLPTRDGPPIAPYTDLLLHDLGPGLADRDLHGAPVPSLWRTAPLWGMSTALEGGRPVRLLHDGRARSIDEAIGWHDGSAATARRRYERLSLAERTRLLDWISAL